MPEEDKEVLAELDDIVDKQQPKKLKKPKKATTKELEKHLEIAHIVDETISDGYIYSGASLILWLLPS